jgi:hypothetical protein
MIIHLHKALLICTTFFPAILSFAPQNLALRHHSQQTPRHLQSAGGSDESVDSLWLLDDDDDDDDDDVSGEETEIDLDQALALLPPIKSRGKSQNQIFDDEDDDEEEAANSNKDVFTSDDGSITEKLEENSIDTRPTLVQAQTSPSSNRIAKNETIRDGKENLLASIQTVGVGRYGYNMTTLHNVGYDIKLYFPANERITYQTRMDLLRDYHNEHEDCNVKFRYTCHTYDYGFGGEKKELYEVALGRWLHNLRKKYQRDPQKIPEEFRLEFDSLGMNWEGVGAGARPETFRLRCKDLKTFVGQNGHDHVPSIGKTKTLGIWVERQRALYRKFLDGGDCGEQLTNARVEMLRDSGFDLHKLVDKSQNGKFSVRQKMFDEEWDRMFSILKEYKDEHGTFDPTVKWDSEDFGSLLYFVAEQRHQHELVRDAYFAGHRNFKSTLTPDRFRALAEINFEFAVDTSLPSPWQDVANYKFDVRIAMELLQEHCKKAGRCEVTLDDVYQSENCANLLMLFIFQQRLRWEYRHEHDWLPVDNERLLDSEVFDLQGDLNRLGFVWATTASQNARSPHTAELKDEYEWWEMYHDLLRYRKANGDFHLEPKFRWFSEMLDNWLEEQKLKCLQLSEGNLSIEEGSGSYITEWHYLALNTVGFEREIGDEPLPLMAGRMPAVLGLESDLFKEIGTLPSDLRDVAVHGTRIDKAEQLAWLVRFASLRRYYSKGGPGVLSNISSDDVSGQRLALWANNQRKQYAAFMQGKKSTMTKRRMDMLDDIEFDWKLQSPGSKEEWEEIKQDLIHFKETYGHCFVPSAYPRNKKLGQWILLQRQLYQQARTSYRHGLVLPVLPTDVAKKRENELLKIGLDLRMDNLSFGNMAFEIVSVFEPH